MTITPSILSASEPIPPIVVGRFNYFVPGLFTPPNDPRTWDYQAQSWMMANGFGRAGGFNYFCDAIAGVVARDYQADLVAGDLLNASVAGFSPIVVGTHSNGSQIILDAAKRHPDLRGLHLHLVGPASKRDCDDNGLNALAASGQLEHAFLYVSPDDEVLIIGGLLYGFGDLGRHGPTNVSPALAGKLTLIAPFAPHCGHSDWVTRDFDATMRSIANNGEAA